ncbi:MAG: efflux RND transporter periplasmic adaptor subunit [Planctomycetota bacterium]
MSSIVRRWLAVAVLALAAVGVADAAAAKDKGKPPARHTVKKGPFKIEVRLKGIFEAAGMTELAFDPEAWTTLRVVKALRPGARVKKGEPVLWLDLEKIDEAIRKIEEGQALADLNVRLAAENLAILEKATPLNLAAAETTHQRFDEDYQRFFEVELPYARKSADFSLKAAEFYLMYATEELRQLEKMYQEDDLTEETEEIILKRARFSVDRAKLSFERSQNTHEFATQFDIPRQVENAKHNAKVQDVEYKKAKTLLPMQLNQKRLELEKLKRDRKEAAEKLAKLRRDREKMTVEAPQTGLVYYGECRDGHWPNADALQGALRRGGTVKPHQVFMTIVQPRPLRVRTTAPEKQLHNLAPGQEAEIAPTGYPDLKLEGTLDTVARVAVKEGHFDVRLSVTTGEDAKALMPGMTCAVTVAAYEKKDATAVPAAMVHTDEADPSKRYVWVLGKDGASARRDVKIGRKNGGKVEILSGLKPGETLVSKKQDAKKPEKQGEKK